MNKTAKIQMKSGLHNTMFGVTFKYPNSKKYITLGIIITLFGTVEVKPCRSVLLQEKSFGWTPRDDSFPAQQRHAR